MTFTKFTARGLDGFRDRIIVPTSPAGPIHLWTWRESDSDDVMAIPPEGCAIVLISRATFVLWPHVAVTLGAGCYAQVPGGALLRGGAGFVIYTPEYAGLPQLGGPAEEAGRLRYIDGCSDSLLVCPSKIGEPCLNLLHLPAGIHQTAHTHPSDRIGIILRGGGECRTPEETVALRPGMFWYIPAGGVHSFHTAHDSLDVFAWHPDSDFGPSHDAHPMLNRTIVDGVAVNDARHAGIRTGEIRA